ncbi:hypothetical protein GCM10010430_31400 [Kitasatospora cystarginea]|uniref:Uncharacterized protein n=1 Tax=Kitasatospora cystarginea TaxID=58350 RepID=A0ABP5QYK4_9ACTN
MTLRQRRGGAPAWIRLADRALGPVGRRRAALIAGAAGKATAGAALFERRHRQPGGGPTDPQRSAAGPYTIRSQTTAASRWSDSDSRLMPEALQLSNSYEPE